MSPWEIDPGNPGSFQSLSHCPFFPSLLFFCYCSSLTVLFLAIPILSVPLSFFLPPSQFLFLSSILTLQEMQGEQ